MTGAFWALVYSLFQISIPHFLAFGPNVLQNNKAVFRIRMFSGLMDPHPDLSIKKQKNEENLLFFDFFFVL
jgi:hypothetical protein